MKTLLNTKITATETFKTFKVESDVKLTKGAQANIKTLTFLAEQLEKSDSEKDNNAAKYVRSMLKPELFTIHNFIARFNVDLGKVSRNKWGKLFWLADALSNKKIPQRGAYEQSQYMYDCFFNVLLKTEFNDHKGASFNAGNFAHRTGNIIDDGSTYGQFQGMKGNTQPYAVMQVLALLSGEKVSKAISGNWHTARLTMSNQTKFGKVLFEFIEDCSDKKLKHCWDGANFAPTTQA